MMQHNIKNEETPIRPRLMKSLGVFLLLLPLLLAAVKAFALNVNGGMMKGMSLSAIAGTGGGGGGGTTDPEPEPEPPPSGSPGDVTGGSVDPRLNAYHISWYENIYPRAMYKNGKTHITYHCYNYDACARSYNHQTRAWEQPVRVGSNSIGGFENSHGNPALLVDRGGQVHVFYGAQQTALKYSRTTTAGDLRTLKAQTSIGTNITYPQPLELSNGNIYLFHRSAGAGIDFGYRSSSDGGRTWSNTVSMIAAPGVWYGFSSRGQNDKIHTVFHLYNTDGSANYPREDIYYMWRNPSDGKWRNINGKIITLPITSIAYADANLKIYDSGGYHTDLDRVRETGSGYLFIGWIEDHSYKFKIHNGSGWEPVRSLSFPDEPPLNQADFDIENNWKIKLYLSIKGGEIGLYESTDLGANWTRKVTQLSGTVHPRKVRVPMIVDSHPPELDVIYYVARDKFEEGDLFLWGPSGYILKQGP